MQFDTEAENGTDTIEKRQELFSLLSTLEHYEVEELSPAEIAKFAAEKSNVIESDIQLEAA